MPLVDLGAWFSLRLRPSPSVPVRPPPRAVLASARSGAGSRRTRRAAPPPRPAGTRGGGRGARSGRRSSPASRAVWSMTTLRHLTGQRQAAQEVGQVVGKREQLEAHRVVAEGTAGQPGPA